MRWFRLPRKHPSTAGSKKDHTAAYGVFPKTIPEIQRTFFDAVIRLIYRLGFHVFVTLRHMGFPRKPGFSVAIWHEGQVLAVQHFYIRGLGIPGGAIAAGETPQIAAIREMK